MATNTKRGQNEGNIRQLEDGRWEGRIMLGWKNGKRHRPSFYGMTRKEVIDAIERAKKAHREGLAPKPDRITIGQFLDSWLEQSVQTSARPRTYQSYKLIVERHLKPALGHHQLDRLTPQHVQALINSKAKENLSPRTVQYIRAVLRQALNKALRWGQVSRNVAALVDPPRSKRHEIQALDPQQARVLLEALEGHPLDALFKVALAMGLRLGEALGLRWADVDLRAGTLNVRVQLQKLDKKFQLTEPKSDRSRRTIVLPAPALDALKDHKLRQELQDKALAGDDWEDWGLVFTSRNGAPLDDSNVRRSLRAILEKAQLPAMRFHDLRHTCASLLLAQGIHPRVVMEILGHSQISLTMNTYSHVVPELQREAAQKMGLLLAGTAG